MGERWESTAHSSKLRPPWSGQEGIARDLGSYLAIAQDGKRGSTVHTALHVAHWTRQMVIPRTEADIMRVAGETPTPVTGGLVCELKAKGEEESAHRSLQRPCRHPAAAHRSRRLENTVMVRFRGSIWLLYPCVTPGHQVSSVDETRWGTRRNIRPL